MLYELPTFELAACNGTATYGEVTAANQNDRQPTMLTHIRRWGAY